MRRLPFALLAALAACSPTAQPNNDVGTADTAADGNAVATGNVAAEAPDETQAATNAAEGNLSSIARTPPPQEQADAGRLPPADRELRFVGRWAANAAMCEDNAWRFTATELNTPAHSVCRFGDVTKVPGGYDVAARCTAESPEQDDVLKLRFAESAQAMMFESNTIADVGLVYCGE